MGHRISLLIPLAAAIVCGCGSSPLPAPVTAANALPLATLEGDSTEIGRIAQGRVAVVNLWATWCEACRNELDALNRLDARTTARRDAVVIGIAVGEPRAVVAAFARDHGLRYVQLVDEDFHFADAIGERRVPATLVLDRAGRVVYRGDALDVEGLAALRGALGSDL
jgi:peroxiredoxin